MTTHLPELLANRGREGGPAIAGFRVVLPVPMDGAVCVPTVPLEVI
jgi:hypothetical protein